MKKTMTIGVVLLAVFTCLPFTASYVSAGEHAGHEHGGAEVAPETAKIKSVDGAGGVIGLNNTKCPVSGEAVSGKHFYTHGGVKYGLCCKKCANEFKANPAKFSLSTDAVHEAMGHEEHAS